MLPTDLEKLRLDALYELEILDTAPEPGFDQITQLASDLYGVPVALISLIDSDRVWFKSCSGLGVDEISRDVSFCDLAIRSDEVLIVCDAARDPRFCLSPLVTSAPHVRFYAGAPIRHGEAIVGSLCLIDRDPRPDIGSEEAKRLQQLASMVSNLLAMRRDAIMSRALLRQRNDIQRKLELMEAVAGVGYWDVDLATKEVTWSKGVYEIHGADRTTYSPDLTTAIDWYHPEDRADIAQFLSDAVATGEDSEFERRIVRADGEVRNVHCRGTVSFDPDGAAKSLFGVLTDITDRLKANQKLETSEARYRLLAERSNDIIAVYDVSGIFQYISPSITTILGYAPEEIVGKTVQDIIYEPDWQPTVEAFHNYIMGKDWSKAFRVQYRARHAQGHLVWLEAHPRPVLDLSGDRIVDFQDVVRDVTEHVVARQAILDSEARYRVLADNANDLVLQCQMDGTVVYASPSAERITGYSCEALVGKTWCSLLQPSDSLRVVSAITQLVESGTTRRREPLEYRFCHRAGHLIHLEGRPTLIFDETVSGPVGFITIIRDISARKTAIEELEAALVAANAANEAKSQFLSMMSHEIRTPLTTILGYANLLAETGPLPGDAQTFAHRIGKAGRTLQGLIDDVLSLAKLEAGQVELKPQSIDLKAFVQDLIDPFQHGALSVDVTLSFDAPTILATRVLIDQTRMSQVLTNLIGNACKFTERGTIRVKVLSVGGKERAQLRFEVIDTGPGIAASEIPKLFQRFHQIDQGMDRKHGGSGLGLAICREIAVLMQGQIGVESEPGVGSTFWIEVPLVPDPLSKSNDIEDVAVSPARLPILGRQILLVDDHAVNRDMIRTLLSGFGANVFEASNGDEAVAQCLERPFDLILMDIQMPKRDGIAAALAIRAQSPVNVKTPIVALTALDLSRLPAGFGSAQFAGVLAKPVKREQLYAVLQTLPSGADG